MSFCHERAVQRTRKPHRCSGCAGLIALGSPAVNWAGTTDGDFVSAYYHGECRTAEIAYNRLVDSMYDEWVGLDELEQEYWPWLVSEHPGAAGHHGLLLEGCAPLESTRWWAP